MNRAGDITVDDTAGMSSHQDVFDLVAMVEIAKKIILDKAIWNTTKAEERQVNKKQAFNHYIKLWEKIKERLHAIHKADDRSTFTISDGLVDQL